MMAVPIEIPVPGLVALVGAAGVGKSTLAGRLFEPSEILSSDALRAVVSGDPTDQGATRTAFAILHREIRRRLAAGRLVVVDATNVEAGARWTLVRLAADAGLPAVAIVIAIPPADVHRRNAGRLERVVPAEIVDRHLARLARLGADPAMISAALLAEGFAAAHVLLTPDELSSVAVRRVSPPIELPGPILADPAAAALLDGLVAAHDELLGERLVGIYLTGSAVAGGYEPGISDLDTVVVITGPAESLDLEHLGAMHRTLLASYPGWDDRLEIVYVGQSTLRRFRTSRGRLAVISPGEPFHLRTDRAAAWAQNWYLLRETGVAVRGPAPTTLIEPIAWTEFVAAAARYADEVSVRDFAVVSPGALADAVLTMCRAAMTVRLSRHGSKQESAAWVAEQWPASADVIAEALRCRRSGGTVGFEDPADRSGALTLIGDLARVVASADPMPVRRPPVSPP